jgi:hypothetical protein
MQSNAIQCNAMQCRAMSVDRSSPGDVARLLAANAAATAGGTGGGSSSGDVRQQTFDDLSLGRFRISNLYGKVTFKLRYTQQG